MCFGKWVNLVGWPVPFLHRGPPAYGSRHPSAPHQAGPGDAWPPRWLLWLRDVARTIVRNYGNVSSLEERAFQVDSWVANCTGVGAGPPGFDSRLDHQRKPWELAAPHCPCLRNGTTDRDSTRFGHHASSVSALVLREGFKINTFHECYSRFLGLTFHFWTQKGPKRFLRKQSPHFIFIFLILSYFF